MVKRLILILLILFLNLKANATSDIALYLDFFEKFNDCYLENYIKEALNNNHELKKASYIVEQFRQEVKNAFSKELPNLGVSANYLGAHFPKGDDNFLIKQNSFILPFRVGYEPDLLLKNRDNTRKEKENYKASNFNRKALYISLLTDVATSYVNILLYDYLIEKQQKIIKYKALNKTKNQHKYDFGVINIIDFNDIEKEYESQKTLLNNLIKNKNKILYNFAVLIGKSPNCIGEIKRGKLQNFEFMGKIPNCISSDVIYQRPDIEEIEHKLKASKIDITIAKKDFFPRFNINGFLVFDTAGMGNFFSWESSFAYLLAGLTQDIFTGGKKIANLKIKKAKYCELMEEYKQKDLNAINEVNNALNIIKEDTKSEKNFKEQLRLQKINYVASDKKLKYGTISAIEYINDAIEYYQKEQFLAISKALRLVDYFTLYKAVGGKL